MTVISPTTTHHHPPLPASLTEAAAASPLPPSPWLASYPSNLGSALLPSFPPRCRPPSNQPGLGPHSPSSLSSPPCSYPYNLDFDYGPLEGLQKFCINNLGDPFIESNYGVHSREFEIGVLQWFARLWEIDQDDFWG